ncbi:MAG: DUF6485 family protein [Planctomycetia bacterium]|nr:DUF6485 family protein [Planctomycetia bacterium]
MECKKMENRKTQCTCSYSCPKRGMCCECVSSHLRNREVPGCFFPKDAEATYDRSFEYFAKLIMEKKC